MNVLFTDTMTIYNYLYDEETGNDVWLRSVITGVQWSHNKSEVITSDNVQTETKVEKITVDFQRDYGNKPYLPHTEYAKLKKEEAAAYWTINAKSGQDVMILGESDKEIGEEYRISDLQNDYQYAVTVTAVSDNRNRPRLKQIKVVGK